MAMALLPKPGLLSLNNGLLKFVVRDRFVSVSQHMRSLPRSTARSPSTSRDTVGPFPDVCKIYAGLNHVISGGAGDGKVQMLGAVPLVRRMSIASVVLPAIFLLWSSPQPASRG